MSIQLRDGLANQTVDHILEDLLVRFVINCPDEDLSSIERVFFQVEEAQWFYTDFITQLYPLVRNMKMKSFAPKLLHKCPLLWKWGDPADALSRFGKYKSTIPVRGIALLNKDMTKVVLVQGIRPPTWSFPRGKISKGEDDLVCAVREVREETGFDAKDYVHEKDVLERTVYGKNFKIYLARNVPEDYVFEPEARNEIALIQWFEIKSLQKQVKENPNKFFIVDPFLKPLTRWVNKNKGVVSDEELMRLAEVRLKELMGILTVVPTESAGAGRELLDILQGVAKPPTVPDSTTLGSPSAVTQPQNIQMNVPPHLQNLYAGMGQAPQFFPPTNGFVPMPFGPPRVNGGYLGNQGQHIPLPPPPQFPQPSQQISQAQRMPQASLPQIPPSPAQQVPLASPSQQFPQASPANTPTNNANSKELLSILKGGPQKKEAEPKSTRAGEFLQMLNRKPESPTIKPEKEAEQKSTRAGEFLQMLSKKPESPASNPETPPKVILKREKGTLESDASATLLGLLGKKPPVSHEKELKKTETKTTGHDLTPRPRAEELLNLIIGGKKQGSKANPPKSSEKPVDSSTTVLSKEKTGEKNPTLEVLQGHPVAQSSENVFHGQSPHENKQASGELLSILNQPKKPVRIAKREEGSPDLRSVLGENPSAPAGESSANTSLNLILSTLNRKSTTPQPKPMMKPTPPPEDFEEFENFDDFDDFDELSASQNDIYNSIAKEFDVDSDDNFEEAKVPEPEVAAPQNSQTNAPGNQLLQILNGGRPSSTGYQDTYGVRTTEVGSTQQNPVSPNSNGADFLRVLGRRPPTVESTPSADGRNELLSILKGPRA